MSSKRVQESMAYLNKCFNGKKAISDKTLSGGYLVWLADLIKENRENPLYRDEYLPMIKSNQSPKKPVFASVIMRTQGKRPEALREALLCLYAQSDRDFEILLIGHKINDEQKALIENILDELDPEFRKQLHFHVLNKGTRTTPINYGFSLASGEYAMVFDDDDLLFEDWIHNFHEAARKAPGTLLHCYAYAQSWKMIEGENGQQALCAVSAPNAKFCVNFNMIRQLSLNLCPLMTIAFPTVMFHEFGFIYDETLTTTEDWDYIMRMAFICGVTDIEEAGAIYRLWENVENSATIHSPEEWAKNFHLIRNKHKKMSIVFANGAAYDLEPAAPVAAPSAVNQIMDDKLYYGCDQNWSEERSMILETPCSVGSFEMVYGGLTDKHTYRKLRWDPASYGNFYIRNLGASVTDIHGETYYFKPRDISTTGHKYHNGYLFLKDDPQVYFTLPKGFKVKKFTVCGESMMNMPIWENHKALRIFVAIKKVLGMLHFIKL